jgi:hypothetical protein
VLLFNDFDRGGLAWLTTNLKPDAVVAIDALSKRLSTERNVARRNVVQARIAGPHRAPKPKIDGLWPFGPSALI